MVSDTGSAKNVCIDSAEIVMVLVGVVWGLGVGFAIVSSYCLNAVSGLTGQVAVGTILGEVANFL
jgi:hypothetical protein